MIVESPKPIEGVTYFSVDGESTWHTHDVMDRVGEALSARGFTDNDESDEYNRRCFKVTVIVEKL